MCKILLVAVNIALAGLLSVIEAQWGPTSGARGNGETRERREGAHGSVDIGWKCTGQDVTLVVIWKSDLIISDIIASE